MNAGRKKVEFYFEFASPYAYLSSEVIESLCRRRGVGLVWKPFMLGPIIRRTGTKPLFMDGLRGAYAKMDCERWAMRAGILFRHWATEPVNSLKAARGALVMKKMLHADHATEVTYIHACFRAHFVKGLDLSDTDILTRIVVGLDKDPEAFLTGIGNASIKQSLIDETESAYERGVFGSPTFFYEGEMFWGNDRLALLEERIGEDTDPAV